MMKVGVYILVNRTRLLLAAFALLTVIFTSGASGAGALSTFSAQGSGAGRLKKFSGPSARDHQSRGWKQSDRQF
jgi:hypothetical protein